MSLKNLLLFKEYRNKELDIQNEFYIPCLKESITYKRGVGYFSSSALAEIAYGIQYLRLNGGHIQLVASPELSDEDFEAIKKGYELRNVITSRLNKSLEEPINDFQKDALNLLANLVADGTLDFRIALVVNNGRYGIYHEKVGIFEDKEGNRVAFSGSMNESRNAFDYNYEQIDVFCSWNSFELDRVDLKTKAFDKIWYKNDSSVLTLEFPEIKDEFIKKYRVNSIDYVNYLPPFKQSKSILKIRELPEGYPQIPDNVTLDPDYQVPAIDSWERNDFCGIFDMATGTGKTYTGLGAICRLSERLKYKLFVLIIVPYQHLVDQWVEDIKKFHMSPIIAYSSSPQKNWQELLSKSILNQSTNSNRDFVCVISTIDTFISKKIQNQLSKVVTPILLVVDEAHNIGAPIYRKYLDDRFQYRLALSATVDRHHDVEGTEFIYEYFRNVCIKYDLERAIKEKKLTEYEYHPVLVTLTSEELEQYKLLTREISRCISKGKGGVFKVTKRGELLLLKRATIVAGAINKLSILKQVITPFKKEHNMLIYCGATSINTDSLDDIAITEIRQIDAVISMLGNELGMKVSKFTSSESSEQRALIIQSFTENNGLQAIVAIRCLDEGVNIPGIQKAFILASSTNPKEYIQRRGRVLRIAKGKEKAEIYDFVTVPRDLNEVMMLSDEEKKGDLGLIKNEISRMSEFSRLAINSMESNTLIWKLKDLYNIV